MPLTRYLRIKIPLFALNLFLLFFLIPLASLAQMKTITGVVTDENGNPLPNISVSVKGSTVGTTTDEKGKYTINADVGATLIFTSVNHDAFNLVIDSRNEYNLNLKAKINSLTDVVVVGYGKQKKVNMVGAVGTVTFDNKITSRTLPNASSALTGLVPGLTAIQNSGMAGRNSATLLIRGLGTVNNASPLIVVDGMPDVDINRVNMNDIETISVLKDATSASVYGSRAANGVILITTKSGKGSRKTSINFNSNMAVTVPTRAFDFMADYPRALTLHQRRAATNTLPSKLSI
jgi:TonB-dependent SusC/RagA subfamily outer membrane receptor